MINPSGSNVEDNQLLSSLEKRMMILESEKSSHKEPLKMSITEITTPKSVSLSQQFPQDISDNDFLDRLD